MNSKETINKIYERIVEELDICGELFETAEELYTDLGEWIDKETVDLDIIIYPQGSFALGTVIKPLSAEDDYDLDLVCNIIKSSKAINARKLKVDIIKPLLVKYKEVEDNNIKEKRRCWQVKYKEHPNFHMDIIPCLAVLDYNKETRDVIKYIKITDKDEEIDTYKYIGSNPAGYIEWFQNKNKERYDKKKEELIHFRTSQSLSKYKAEIVEVKEYEVKTSLQKAIQLLKRHRDIMYENDETNVKPISIIITTIAAQLYNNEDNIYDTLNNVLSNAGEYVKENMQNGRYYIENPSYTGNVKENFADKWNEHQERADAFFNWIEKARRDLVEQPSIVENMVNFASLINESLGSNIVEKAIKEYDINLYNEVNLLSQSKELSSYRPNEQLILTASHRKIAPWKLPKGHRIFIKSKVTEENGNQYNYVSNGSPINKKSSIDFTALLSIKGNYILRWQIVNIGEEARFANGLRGDFYSSDTGKLNTRNEKAEYKGSHSIQCFAIKNGRCVAKSDIFIVNII